MKSSLLQSGLNHQYSCDMIRHDIRLLPAETWLAASRTVAF